MMHATLDADEPEFGAFGAPMMFRRIVGQDDISTPHPLRGWRRKIAKRYLRWTDTPYDVTYRGLRLRLFPGENAGDLQIVMHGVHSEEDEFDVFEREVVNADVFVDIGANIGLYSMLAARHIAPAGRIIAFEPTPRTRSKLERNLALNGAAGKVEIVPAAVGDAPDTLKLVQVNRWNAGQNTLNPMSGAASEDEVEVPVVVLEQQLSKMNVTHVDILKIDIEGFEDQALFGFFNSAPDGLMPRYVMLETCHRHVWQHDLLGAISQRGYALAFENDLNMHFRRTGAPLL